MLGLALAWPSGAACWAWLWASAPSGQPPPPPDRSACLDTGQPWWLSRFPGTRTGLKVSCVHRLSAARSWPTCLGDGPAPPCAVGG